MKHQKVVHKLALKVAEAISVKKVKEVTVDETTVKVSNKWIWLGWYSTKV